MVQHCVSILLIRIITDWIVFVDQWVYSTRRSKVINRCLYVIVTVHNIHTAFSLELQTPKQDTYQLSQFLASSFHSYIPISIYKTYRMNGYSPTSLASDLREARFFTTQISNRWHFGQCAPLHHSHGVIIGETTFECLLHERNQRIITSGNEYFTSIQRHNMCLLRVDQLNAFLRIERQMTRNIQKCFFEKHAIAFNGSCEILAFHQFRFGSRAPYHSIDFGLLDLIVLAWSAKKTGKIRLLKKNAHLVDSTDTFLWFIECVLNSTMHCTTADQLTCYYCNIA